MKRLIPILSIVVLFASCEYEPLNDPYADFSVDYDLVEPREVISFYNESHDASYYEWNFGDGTISTAMNPSHYYEHEGVYEVTLAAHRGNIVDYAYYTIEVYYTTLEIEVRDYLTDELIPRLNVVLYPTYTDFLDFGREVYRGVTDYNGSVVVKGLYSQRYYVDLHNDYYHNWTLAAEDVAFIETQVLQHAMHNTFITYVDYDPIAFKSTGRARVKSTEIKSERRSLEDRKASLK